MTLIKLTTSPEKIEEYNKHIKNCKEKYPDDFNMDYIHNIDDLICPYEDVLRDPENKDILSDVKDTLTDFTGIYMNDQLDWIVSNYINEKIIDDNPFNISERFRICDYGVCDNASQVIEYYQNLEKEMNIDLGKCVLCLRPIVKKFQPENGGWRWHKWGPYIGVKEPHAEYIFDEDDDIRFVWCFHLYGMEEI